MEKEFLIEENAVEQWVKTNFTAQRTHEMTEEQAKTFCKLVISQKMIDEDEECAVQLKKNKLGLASILYHRCSAFNIILTNSVCLFLGGFIAETPGDCSMLSAFLLNKAFEKRERKIDIYFLSKYCFPMGFPNREDFNAMWQTQKIDAFPDNLLDYKKGYQSIMWED